MNVNQVKLTEKTALSARQQLENLCQRHPSVSLFLNPFWLDTVCVNGTWDVCLSYDNGGEIDGVLVYYMVKLKGVITNEFG